MVSYFVPKFCYQWWILTKERMFFLAPIPANIFLKRKGTEGDKRVQLLLIIRNERRVECEALCGAASQPRAVCRLRPTPTGDHHNLLLHSLKYLDLLFRIFPSHYFDTYLKIIVRKNGISSK
jgi:hypothetical protein